MSNTFLKYGGHEIEVVPVGSGGFYCRWNGGSTYIAPTAEAAVFLAERVIDLPQPKLEEYRQI